MSRGGPRLSGLEVAGDGGVGGDRSGGSPPQWLVRLWAAHALSRAGTQAWNFCVPLLLLQCGPGLQAPALYVLCRSGAKLALAPRVGRRCDAAPRLSAVRFGATAQGVGVLVTAALAAGLAAVGPTTSDDDTRIGGRAAARSEEPGGTRRRRVLAGLVATYVAGGRLWTTLFALACSLLGAFEAVAVPGEMEPGLAQQVRAELGRPDLVVLGLCDDEVGYLMREQEAVAPLFAYERSMSPCRRAGELVRAALTGVQRNRGL